MIEKFLEENPILKRALLTLLGTGLVAFGKKFGLEMDDAQIAAITAIIIAAVSGSNWKAAAVEKARVAAESIKTPEDAAKELSK